MWSCSTSTTLLATSSEACDWCAHLPNPAAPGPTLARKTCDLVSVSARVARDDADDRAGYGTHQLRLSAELTRALLLVESPGTPDDVLMGALHLAIALWNIEHGVACGRVGVLTPVSLRPQAWRDEVVGNFTLLVRMRTSPDVRSLGHVIPVVAAQTRRMREEDTLAALIELLGRTSSLPTWMKRGIPALLAVTGTAWSTRPNWRPSATLLTSREAGETLDLWFSPPARMPLGVSMGRSSRPDTPTSHFVTAIDPSVWRLLAASPTTTPPCSAIFSPHPSRIRGGAQPDQAGELLKGLEGPGEPGGRGLGGSGLSSWLPKP
jgi:hypothetical protein